MALDVDKQREILKAAIDQAGLDPTRVSLAIGAGKDFLRDFLIGKKGSIKAGRLPDIEQVLGLPPGTLVMAFTGLESRALTKPPIVIPGHELVGDRDFPVYAGAQGGSGHLVVGSDVVEYRKRPSILEGVKHGYGLLVFGDSMSPAYRHGDMALVHPGLPPQRDEVHIFYDHPPFGEDGETEAIIKNLVGWSDTKWRLQQYNPPEKFDVDRVDWPTAHQVVGKYGRR